MKSASFFYISILIIQLLFGTKLTTQVLKLLNCIANVGSLKVFDRWMQMVHSESNLAPVPENLQQTPNIISTNQKVPINSNNSGI
jgi:hypothetical protein